MNRLDRSLWAVAFAIGMLLGLQIHIENGFQHNQGRCLDDTVFDRRYSERTLLPIGFRNVNTTSGLGSILLRSQFLRQFGQSDRDQIQASHTEANVPQVLALLNGFIDKQVLSNRDSALMASIDEASSDKDKVRRAYLSIINREPRGRELAVWVYDMETEGRQVLKDLVWTLVNSHEFRFIQ